MSFPANTILCRIKLLKTKTGIFSITISNVYASVLCVLDFGETTATKQASKLIKSLTSVWWCWEFLDLVLYLIIYFWMGNP